jgi:hypothetical protein
VLIVVTNLPWPEEEFNRWYSNRHLDDVLRVPGSSQRSVSLTMDGAQSLPGPYLAIYEMKPTTPPRPLPSWRRLRRAEKCRSPALDTTNIVSSIFTPITERKRARSRPSQNLPLTRRNPTSQSSGMSSQAVPGAIPPEGSPGLVVDVATRAHPCASPRSRSMQRYR